MNKSALPPTREVEHHDNGLPITQTIFQGQPSSPSSPQSALSHHDATAVGNKTDVGSIIARHQTVASADSLATIDQPPGDVEELPASKIYHPYSIHVLALLMPASIFGVLSRLGLQALVTYNGQSVFPLAYIQATGCFIMGIALGMKAPFGRL
jgi:hypothetical protein